MRSVGNYAAGHDSAQTMNRKMKGPDHVTSVIITNDGQSRVNKFQRGRPRFPRFWLVHALGRSVASSSAHFLIATRADYRYVVIYVWALLKCKWIYLETLRQQCVQFKITSLILKGVHIILYRSIALERLYKMSFKSNRIGAAVLSLINFKSLKKVKLNASYSKCLTLIKFYTLKF